MSEKYSPGQGMAETRRNFGHLMTDAFLLCHYLFAGTLTVTLSEMNTLLEIALICSKLP
jgi:hypothetical protein